MVSVMDRMDGHKLKLNPDKSEVFLVSAKGDQKMKIQLVEDEGYTPHESTGTPSRSTPRFSPEAECPGLSIR